MKIKLFTNSGIFDRSVVLEGFTMAGHLTLARNPMTANEAATKRYVDNLPYSLSVDVILGGPVRYERIGAGISGDVVTYNASQTALKSVGAAGSYSRVTVNSKGQIVSGIPVYLDNTDPSLMFSEIKSRPTTVDGYAAAPTNYIRTPANVNNTAFSSALTLFRAPTAGAEVATFGYLTNIANTAAGKQNVGDLVIKPNTIVHNKYLRANGATLDRASYQTLYSAIGDQYGLVPISIPVAATGEPWVQQGTLNEQTNPTTFTWTQLPNSLPVELWGSKLIVTKNRMYTLGGVLTNAVVATQTIYTATLAADGTPSAWTVAGSLPGAVYSPAVFMTKNRLFLMGGSNGTNYLNTILSAPINADGTIGSWSNYGTFPEPIFDATVVATNNRVHILGFTTSNGTKSDRTYSAAINVDGTIGSWTAGTTLPYGLAAGSPILTSSYIYLIGGIKTGSFYTNTVFRAPVNADGSIGTWVTMPNFPNINFSPRYIVTKSMAYILGGFDGTYSLNTIYYAPIDSNGVLGSWTLSSSTLPYPAWAFLAAVVKNRLIIINGNNNSTIVKAVYSTPFNGGTNDYLTVMTEWSYDTTKFKLPDLSSKKDGIYEYYIKATA